MKKKLLACVAIISLLAQVADAAVTPNSIVTAQTPNRGTVQFLQGTDSAGTYKTIYTGGTNGSKCTALWESNNDASATHLITVQIKNGSVQYGGTSLTTASNDGFANGVPPKNLMQPGVWPGLPIDDAGNPYIMLASGDLLQATFATAITTSDLINAVATCSDF